MYWNRVVIPIIEYKLQCIVLSEKETNTLDSKIRQTIKRALNMATTVPNFIVHDKDMLNVKRIEHLQREILAKNLLYMLNDEGELGKITRISTITAQGKLWHENCIVGDIEHIDTESNIWIVRALKNLNKVGFKLCIHNKDNEKHDIAGGYMSIKEFLSSRNIKIKNINSIKSTKVIYVTQLIEKGNRMIKWGKLTRNAGRSKRGRIPNWFLMMERYLIKCKKTREVWPIYRISDEIRRKRIENEYIDHRGWERFESEFNAHDKTELLRWDDRIKSIEDLVEEEQQRRILLEIHMKLIEEVSRTERKKNIKIYCDASYKKSESALAWTFCGENDKILEKYACKIKEISNVKIAELLALTTSILVCPSNTSVEVFTDSAYIKKAGDEAILEFNNLTRRSWNKDHIYIWEWIRKFIRKHKIQIKITKIKAHSCNKMNDYVDSLAKIARRNKETIRIKMEKIKEIKYKLYYNDTLILESPRSYMKKVNYLKEKAEWLALEQNDWLKNNITSSNIDWKASYEMYKEAIEAENNDLNNNKIGYKMKNLIEKLPVYKVMNQRNPSIYKNPYCVRCKRAVESWKHIWICRKNKTDIYQILENIVNKYSGNKIIKERFGDPETWKAKFTKVFHKESKNFRSQQIVHEALKGMINEELYLSIKDKKYKKLVKDIVHEMIEESREIWANRCKEVAEWEKKEGIDSTKNREGKKQINEKNNIKGQARKRMESQFIGKTTKIWLKELSKMKEGFDHTVIWYRTETENVWPYNKIYRRSNCS